MCTLDTESKDSDDLSPDDVCECGHTFAEHVKNDEGAFVCVAGPEDADDAHAVLGAFADECRNFKLALTALDRRLVRHSGIDALADDPCACDHTRRDHNLRGTACRHCPCSGYAHALCECGQQIRDHTRTSVPMCPIQLGSAKRRRPPCRECGHGHPESMANGQCPRRMCECEAPAHHPEPACTCGHRQSQHGWVVGGRMTACTVVCEAGFHEFDLDDDARRRAADELTRLGEEIQPYITPESVTVVSPAEHPVGLPYRVTYALQGGLTAQADVSGDASVEAIDGVLTVTHRGLPVLGILRVDTFPTSGEAHGGTDHGEQQGRDVPGR